MVNQPSAPTFLLVDSLFIFGCPSCSLTDHSTSSTKVTELTRPWVFLPSGWNDVLPVEAPSNHPSFWWGKHVSHISSNLQINFYRNHPFGEFLPWHNMRPRNPKFPIYEDPSSLHSNWALFLLNSSILVCGGGEHAWLGCSKSYTYAYPDFLSKILDISSSKNISNRFAWTLGFY